MKRLFAIILSLCLLLGVLPEAMAATQHTHRWSQWYPEREATCDYGGDYFRYCLDCQQYDYKSTPALGHNYQKKVVDQATCLDWGLAEYTCSRCGSKYQDEIAPLGHKWGGWIVDTPSTCVSYGTHYHVCQRCGAKEWERNYADGLGDHDWGEWKVIAQPGLGTTGLEERVCKNDASHKEQREIPAITVVVNVWLEVKPFDVPDYPIEGSEIVSEIIIHNDGNVPITLVDCLLPDQAEGDWKTWEEFAGLVLEPGEIAGYLHGMIVNSKDIAVKEALRTVANTYTYVSASGTVGTGQTNPVQPRYPVLPGGASLKLELSWDPDEGVGKAYLDAPIHVQFKLTNTGAAPVVLDKPLGYYDPSLLEDMTALPVIVFDDTQFYLLDPGATLTFTRVFPVDQASLDHMSLFGEVSMEGQPMLSEEHLGDYVWSNAVYMEIPLTKEQDGYVLKGATASFAGYELDNENNAYWLAWDNHSIECIWKDQAPEMGQYGTGIGGFYLDANLSTFLTVPPVEGETYYFNFGVYSAEYNPEKFDFAQIEPDLVSCSIEGFSVAFVKADCYEDEIGKGVELTFSATYQGTSPSLFLEISWAPDEGVGKVVGDTIRERFKLTNTGNVTVAVPARLTDRHEDVVQPNWYLEINGTTYTVLKPGWDMEWTFLDEVYPEDAEKGSVSWSTSVFGYVLNLADETPGDAVLSNTAYIDIPLTGSEPAIKVPSLKLITTASPMKASYPYAELYGECEVVRIDYVLINNGEVPLVIDKLMERWGDDHETFLPLNILLYPGESYSDYTNVWLVANLITPTSLTAGIAGTVDVEYYAFGRDCDDTDIVLCETTHSPYSFTMEEPGPTGWEIPSESELWIWKYEKEAPTLPEGYQKGEQIVYVLEVVNMSDYVYGSDVEVSGAVLTDNMLGISETLPAIPAGSSVIREYPYTVNDIDVNTGWIYNEASVKWIDPDSGEEMIHETWDLVDTTDKTSLMLKKEIVGGPKNGEYYVEGEEITFQVTAKNNTDKVLPLVFVNEPLLEGDSETLMEINDMQPGAEQGEMFKYKVTEADVSLGYVGNMATSEYEDANGDWHKITSNYVEADTGKKTPVNEDETPKPPAPPYKPVFGVVSDIRITKAQDKEPDNGNYFVEGETIRYAITVKNEGEVPVDADIYDSLAPGSGLIGTVTGLAPNDSKTVYYEYKVTKDDVDATCVVNYALAKWHPQNVWAETVYMSNKVTSPTSEKQPNPDEHLEFTGEGDSCYRMLTDVSEYNEGYLLHLCAEHAAVETETGEDWQKAAALWREAVDKEYEKYLEAAEGAARVTVINERLTYYLWIGAYEKQLKLLYPDDPDTVARLVAENLMDRCIDLCAGEHYDGKKPLDSLIGARVMPGPDPAEVCERRILSRDGTEITYAFALDAKHAATEKNALALVREAELGAGKAAAWARAQQLWQMALDKEVNARYKAANKEDRQVIAMTRRFLDQLVTARTALLELVYNGDSVIVNERIEQMYKEYAIMLCGK